MTDAELLAKLLDIGLFESRDEAEHVVDCATCDVSARAEYRCPENPVQLRGAAEDKQRAEWEQAVWDIGSCQSMSEFAWTARPLPRSG